MRVRMTMLGAVLSIVAILAIEGFAQDPVVITQDPNPPTRPGHTLDELGQGIKSEARQVGQKLGEVGQGIKAEARQVSSGVARRFDSVKADVNRMPTQHRVYSRIHWDKTLHDANIEVHLLPNGTVLLRGTVPTEAARKHAIELAMGSVDVVDVYDELTVLATANPRRTAAAPKSNVGH